MGHVFQVMLVHPSAAVRQRGAQAIEASVMEAGCEAFASFGAAREALRSATPDVAVVDLEPDASKRHCFLADLHHRELAIPVIGIASLEAKVDHVTQYRYGIRDVVRCEEMDRLAMAVIREAEFAATQRRLQEALDDLGGYWSTFRTMVEHMPILVDALDKEGRIIFWNRECERVTGYTAEEVVGNPRSRELVYPDAAYRAELTQRWKERGNNFRDWECTLTCKNGERRIIAWSSISDRVPVPGWEAWSVGVDVTERRRVEEAEAAASRLEATATLAGGIAHDFNNLLAVIMGNAGLAREALGDDHHVTDWLKDVEWAAERAAVLALQLLAFAQRGQYHRLPVDCNERLSEILRSDNDGALKGKRIQTRLQEHLPPLEVDPTLFAMLVSSLLVNAIEACEDNGGEITVITRALRGGPAQAPGIGITVHDTGVGMTEEVRTRAFEPFFTTKFQGRGLGLAAVHGIVLSHGGTIRIDSAPGAGTTVEAWFPAADPPPTPEQS